MTPGTHRYQQLSAALEELERNPLLDVAESFVERVDAADLLELHLYGATLPDPDEAHVIERAEALKQRLDAANNRLFNALRAGIRANDYIGVRRCFQQVAQQLPEADGGPGYDALDMLTNGLLETGDIPEEAAALEADLVFYLPTPARIVLKLARLLQPTSDDIFYDLGSGLGHVPILMHLLTGVHTWGVELEASYCRYARDCAGRLGLGGVNFIHADARRADFADGTIFYLYTPFLGEPLWQVLGRLEQEAGQRHIRVCSYGPCTAQIARQPWLKAMFQQGTRETAFGAFESVL